MEAKEYAKDRSWNEVKKIDTNTAAALGPDKDDQFVGVWVTSVSCWFRRIWLGTYVACI